MSQLAQTTQPTSATNFDLPSLHILHNEIEVALKNAEHHLGEFNDDEEQAPLLLDSVDVTKLLAEILDLLSLDGGSDLTKAISSTLQLLYDNGDNNDDALILDISEAIMTLNRYVEFVLLKETLEPSLLVPIINKLNAHLHLPEVDESLFSNRGTNSISISNPEQNYNAPAELQLDVTLLAAAYRSGLAVVISNSGQALTADEQKKLKAMESACSLVSSKSHCLFWQAATAAVMDIKDILPLNNAQKRTLVFLEQQFHNYLSINDKRFADLVTFACHRNNVNSQAIQAQYDTNNLNQQDYDYLKRFLFGPDRDVSDTVNDILQLQISKIKDSVDKVARGVESTLENPISADSVAEQLENLGSTLTLLALNEAAQVIKAESLAVGRWEAPTPKDFDQLLLALIVAENASISLSKEHTPGAVKIPLHNKEISLHQLNTSYETLVLEARSNIHKIEEAIIDFTHEEQKDRSLLEKVPEYLQQLVGPLAFLHLNDASKMTNRLANYVKNNMLASEESFSDEQLARVADIIVAVEFHLDGMEKNHPVNNQTMNIGHESLKQLLAA